MQQSLGENKKIENLLNNKKIVKVLITNNYDISICWDLHGLLNPKIYRRHVFICSSYNDLLIQQTFSVLKILYETFRNGDLYTIGTFTSKRFNWQEKSKVDKVCLDNFIGKNKNNFPQKNNTFLSLLEELAKYRDPTFVFINLEEKYQIQWVEKKIHELRINKNVNCLFMVYSPLIKQNYIQFSKGICYLSRNKLSISDVLTFYRSYDNRLACLSVEVVLESLSGDVFLNKDVWSQLEFSAFSRKLYYPMSETLIDTIETYRLYNEKKTEWNFRIILNYQLLNGDSFAATRQLSIPLFPGCEKVLTTKAQYDKRYELFLGIELSQNPFEKSFILEPGVGI